MEWTILKRAQKGILQDPELIELKRDLRYLPEDLKEAVESLEIESDEDSIMYGKIFSDDRDVELSSGDGIAIEVRASGLPTHHRVARRLEVKFSVRHKDAVLAAYCLWIIAGLDTETVKWFEGEVASQGWDAAYAYVRKLASELRKEGGSSCDVMGRIEHELPEAQSFATIPLVVEDEGEWTVSTAAQKFNEWQKKIKRAGRKSIGSVGKAMYGKRLTGDFELDKELWALYKQKKSDLYKGA